MPQITRPLSFLWFFLAAFVFSYQVLPSVFILSPTSDEPVEITNGYCYWQGDVVTHNRHPPFSQMLQALPARFCGFKEPAFPYNGDFIQRAENFLFLLNRDRFSVILETSRAVSWLLGLGLGFLLFLLTRDRSPIAGLTALGLWAFDPNLCAFSGLAVADLPVAFFSFAAVLAFQRHLENPGPPRALAVGFLTGLAVTCKFSALVLIPIFLFLEWRWIRSKKRKTPFSSSLSDWAWATGAFLAWIFILYLPGTLLEPGHQNPFTYCLAGFKDMLDYGLHHHHPTYFLRVASRQNHWLYYPVAFLLKSTLPFLILLALAAILALRRLLSVPAWVWAPALGVFLSILPVQNLGLRYLLPAYPFLILIAAFGVEALLNLFSSPVRKIAVRPATAWLLVGSLLSWHAATSLSAGLDQLSYFNELVHADKKIYYFGDSNLDWGQDVKRLAEAGKKRGWGRVRLACLFGVDPSLYGLPWQPWTEKDLQGPQPGQVYAVDIGLLQLGPVFYPDLERLAKSWVTDRTPTGRVGDTWYYFEIPGKAQEDLSPPLPHAQGFRNHETWEKNQETNSGSSTF